MQFRKSLWLVVLFLSGGAVLSVNWCKADTLVLKNGRRMTGRVVSEDDKFVQFDTQGVALKFAQRDIKELIKDSSEKNELEKLKEAYTQGDLFRTYQETLEFLIKYPEQDEVQKIHREAEGKLQDMVDHRVDDALILQKYVDGMLDVEEWLDKKIKPRTPLYSYFSKRYVKIGLVYAEKQFEEEDYKRVLETLDKIERHAEDQQEIIIMRARTLFARSEYANVEKLLEANITSSELKKEKQSLLIRALLFQDKYRDVADLTRDVDVRKITPVEVQKQILARMPIALNTAAIKAYDEGNYVAAKEYFARYMEFAPDDVPTHRKAVEFYGMVHDEKMLQRAKLELERAIRRKQAETDSVRAGSDQDVEFLVVNRMDHAVKLAKQYNRSILLIFEEDNNPNSQLLRGHLNDPSVKRAIAKYFIVVFLNIRDEAEGKSEAFRYSVLSAPTLLIIGRDRIKYGEIGFYQDVPAFLDNYYKSIEKFLDVPGK